MEDALPVTLARATALGVPQSEALNRELSSNKKAQSTIIPPPRLARQKWLAENPKPYWINTKQLHELLEHDNHQMRRELRQFLTAYQLFTPVHGTSLVDERDLALRRLSAICSKPGRFISVYDFWHNPLRIFAAHELIGLADGSLATKLTVQFNLAGGTVLRLGTKRHHDALLDGIDSLDQIGCFALTELAYGNNAVMMETTAVYDVDTKEFVINTPSVGAQKYWITNSAIHANFAVVFAQLKVRGTPYGVHAFVVPIRDKATMKPMSGVYIADMGHKIGCNGVDNGRLSFHNVRVPRTALLNRYSDVLEDGTFKTTVKGRRQLFIKVADQLLSGRLCIASMTLGAIKLAVTIAVKYAISRLAVGKSGQSDTALLSYQLQQRALAPLLARTYACAIALDYCKDRYVALQGCNDDDKWREAVVLCCSIKPMVTWTGEEVVSITRERCGGQGYLSVNRFGDMLGFAHAGITAEGDDSVLMQKTAKELLILVAQRRVSIPRVATRCPLSRKVDELAFLRWLLAAREARLVQELGAKTKHAEKNKKIFEVWMQQESDLVQHTSISFIEMVAFEQLDASTRKADGMENERILKQIQTLYALDCVQRDLGWFLSTGVLTAREMGAAVSDALRKHCTQIGPLLPYLVDTFGIPDKLIHAPIAGDWVSANPLPEPHARL